MAVIFQTLSQVHFAVVGEVQFDNKINKRFHNAFSFTVCILYTAGFLLGFCFFFPPVVHEAYDKALCVLVKWFTTLCTATALTNSRKHVRLSLGAYLFWQD